MKYLAILATLFLFFGCATLPNNVSEMKSIAAVKFLGEGSLNFSVWGEATLQEVNTNKTIFPFYSNNGISFFELTEGNEYRLNEVSMYLNGQGNYVFHVVRFSKHFRSERNILHYLGSYIININLQILGPPIYDIIVNSETNDSELGLIRTEIAGKKTDLEYKISQLIDEDIHIGKSNI